MRLLDCSSEALEYALRFEDADKGLGKCSYGSSQDFPYVPVPDWMFTFVSQSESVEI
jgi:hypothetical protein